MKRSINIDGETWVLEEIPECEVDGVRYKGSGWRKEECPHDWVAIHELVDTSVLWQCDLCKEIDVD